MKPPKSGVYAATSGDHFLASLDAFMQRTGQGRHYGVTVIKLASAPDDSHLEKAWHALHMQQPLLHSKLKRNLLNWQLRWQLKKEVAVIPNIIKHTALEPSKSQIQLRLSGKDDAEQRLPYIYLEIFADKLVLLSWCHGIIDGTGLNLLVQQLASGKIVAEVRGAAALVPKGRWQKIKQTTDRLSEISSVGCNSAWRQGQALAGEPEFRVLELNAEQSEQAYQSCAKHCGHLMQMPFYAAVALRALRRLHLHRATPLALGHLEIPVQKSKRASGQIFQNQMHTLTLAAKLEEMVSLSAAAQQIMELYQQALRNQSLAATAALHNFMRFMPCAWFIPFLRRNHRGEICSLYHSHTGSFSLESFAAATVQNIYAIPSVSTPPALGIFFSDYAQRLTITVAWRSGSLIDTEARLIEQQLLADLTCAT